MKVMFGEWLHLLKRRSIRGSCIGLDEHLCTQAHGTHYLGRSTESVTTAEGDQKGGRGDHLTRAAFLQVPARLANDPESGSGSSVWAS